MISIQLDESIPVAEIFEAKEINLLQQAVMETLRQAGGSSESELAVVITGDSQLQELNLKYLGVDSPTDVLSFPSHDTDPDTGELYLGDILISYPRALEQSVAGGHPIQDEIMLLVVHGVLHLLGYDHVDEAGQAEMWAIQSATLNRLGSSIRGPALPSA